MMLLPLLFLGSTLLSIDAIHLPDNICSANPDNPVAGYKHLNAGWFYKVGFYFLIEAYSSLSESMQRDKRN